MYISRSKMYKDMAFVYIAVFLIPYGLAYFGETVQGNPEMYWQIRQIAGRGLANFILGNLSDLMTPLIFGGACAFFIWTLGRIFKKDAYTIGFYVLIMASCLMSIALLRDEINALFIDTSRCGGLTEVCPGDFSDMLCFSVPLISLVIWGLYTKRKS